MGLLETQTIMQQEIIEKCPSKENCILSLITLRICLLLGENCLIRC